VTCDTSNWWSCWRLLVLAAGHSRTSNWPFRENRFRSL